MGLLRPLVLEPKSLKQGGDNSGLEPGDLGSKSSSAANCLGDLGKVLCLLICLLGYKMRPLGSVTSVTFWWQVLVPLEQKSTYALFCG